MTTVWGPSGCGMSLQAAPRPTFVIHSVRGTKRGVFALANQMVTLESTACDHAHPSIHAREERAVTPSSTRDSISVVLSAGVADSRLRQAMISHQHAIAARLRYRRHHLVLKVRREVVVPRRADGRVDELRRLVGVHRVGTLRVQRHGVHVHVVVAL